MSRLKIVDPAQATGKAKDLLAGVQKKLGLTPNMTKVMANSPAVLEGYIHFSGSLGSGVLSPRLREQIALVVGESNGCEYCVSAHSTIGKLVGLNETEIGNSRGAKGSNPRETAALQFARELVRAQGRVSKEAVEALKAADFNDGEVAEIIANVALNIFTNYFNNTADVDVDFPKVALRKTA
jgi:uncharacterized peroxidase-related enzyme